MMNDHCISELASGKFTGRRFLACVSAVLMFCLGILGGRLGFMVSFDV